MAMSPACWIQGLNKLHQCAKSSACKAIAFRAAIIKCQQAVHRSTSKSSILGRSAILVQDGLKIKELPLVMRKMTEFPFTSVHSAGNRIRTESEEEFAFQSQLNNCLSVQQVFRLLEVPGDTVTTYSAAFALERIAQLQKGSCSDIDSFISKAILHQLCHTATEGVSTLSSDMLIALVECYINLPSFDELYISPINEEIEKRVGDGVLRIQDVCRLIEVLSLGIRSDSELISSLWIHLSNRYSEFDEHCMANIYSILRYITPEHRYILPLLENAFASCYLKLDAKDIQTACRHLLLGNINSYGTMKRIGNWVVLNIQSLTDDDLIHIVTLFKYHEFVHQTFFNSLANYVVAKVDGMDKTLIALIMEYCKITRMLSTRIYDAVARNFVSQGHLYTNHQLVLSLRPFGHLSYLPPNEAQLFSKVEEVLLSRFNELEPALALNLLTSFAYIGRYPMNFLTRVYTAHFIYKIKMMHPVADQESGSKLSFRYLHQLKTAIQLEASDPGIVTRLYTGPRYRGGKASNQQAIAKVKMSQILGRLLGNDYFATNVIPYSTPYTIDFLVYIDKDNKPIPAQQFGDFPEELDCERMLALITFSHRHYCTNIKSLLGEHNMKVRHLEKMGYTVVKLNVSNSKMEWDNRLENILHNYMDLSNHTPTSTESLDTDFSGDSDN